MLRARESFEEADAPSPHGLVRHCRYARTAAEVRTSGQRQGWHRISTPLQAPVSSCSARASIDRQDRHPGASPCLVWPAAAYRPHRTAIAGVRCQLTAYDTERVAREFAALAAPAANATARGRRLQDLAEYLLAGIGCVEIVERNVKNAAMSNEMDIWIRYRARHGFTWPFADGLVPVECKNEKRPVSAAQIRDFAARIRGGGGRDGVLFTRRGVSGTSATAAHHQISVELAGSVRIAVVIGSDLCTLRHGRDLLALLENRLLELRISERYRSI